MPSTAAIAAADRASSSEVSIALTSSALENRDLYHLSVKPRQTTLRRASLKEKTNMTSSGRYRKPNRQAT
ncbi:hypothetical protein D3C83_213490 [compost metagenome]